MDLFYVACCFITRCFIIYLTVQKKFKKPITPDESNYSPTELDIGRLCTDYSREGILL